MSELACPSRSRLGRAQDDVASDYVARWLGEEAFRRHLRAERQPSAKLLVDGELLPGLC